MDGHFNRLAEASLAVSAAEEALGAGAHQGAQDALDRTDGLLAGLRAAWPRMTPAERRVVGSAAANVRERRDAAARALPRRRTLAAVAGEADPDQERPPDELAA